jgi:antitoxin PrlF
MANTKKDNAAPRPGYRGKRAKTGNSLGFRFDKALFQSHPEFSGDVRAHVIAPGTLLVVAEPKEEPNDENDPVLAAFLAFLADDMEKHPEQIMPLDPELMARIDALVGDIPVDLNEDLGDDPLLDEIF